MTCLLILTLKRYYYTGDKNGEYNFFVSFIVGGDISYPQEDNNLTVQPEQDNSEVSEINNEELEVNVLASVSVIQNLNEGETPYAPIEGVIRTIHVSVFITAIGTKSNQR